MLIAGRRAQRKRKRQKKNSNAKDAGRQKILHWRAFVEFEPILPAGVVVASAK